MKRENKEFTVIVPVRNRAQLVTRCLDSIHGQTYRPLKVVVVDNGSTDSTRRVVEEWMREHRGEDFRCVLMDEERAGACRARNKGMEEVESEYLCFFDSDDMMRPEMVEECMGAFMEDDGGEVPDLVYWKVGSHQEEGDVKELNFRGVKGVSRIDRGMLKFQLLHSLLRTQGYAVRRGVLERSGLWDETLPIWNDWELGVRILSTEGIRLRSIDRVLADSYPQRESITGVGYSEKIGLREMSIDRVAEDLAGTGMAEGFDYGMVLRGLKVILAAHYYREGKREEGERRYRELVEGMPLRERLRLAAVYHLTRLLGRGTTHLL